MYETVKLVRDIFFKCFVVSVIYYLLITALYLFKIDWVAELMNTYYRVSPTDTHILCGYYMAAVEIITFNILMIPTIGLHWASCCLKKKEKEE